MEYTDQELYDDLCRTIEILFREEIELAHFHVGEITLDLFRLGMIKDENDHWAHEVHWYNYPDPTYKPENFDERILEGKSKGNMKCYCPKYDDVKHMGITYPYCAACNTWCDREL